MVIRRINPEFGLPLFVILPHGDKGVFRVVGGRHPGPEARDDAGNGDETGNGQVKGSERR